MVDHRSWLFAGSANALRAEALLLFAVVPWPDSFEKCIPLAGQVVSK